MRRIPVFMMVLTLLALSACNSPFEQVEALPEDSGSTETDAQSAEVPAADQPAADQPPTDEAPPAQEGGDYATAQEACPEPGEGTQLIVNELGGYCFLAPADFTVRTEDNGPWYRAYDTWAMGKVLPTGGQEAPAYYLAVNVIGAPGQAGDVAAEQWLADFMSPLGPIETLDPVTVAGRQVPVILEPGMFAARSAYINVEGTLYAITTLHTEMLPDETARAEIEAYWAQALESMTFYQPQFDTASVVTHTEACPEAGEGTQLIVDLQGGFCYLLPADWSADPDFPGRYIGGPDIGEYWGAAPTQATVSVSSTGAPEDSFEEFLAFRKANSPDPAQYTYEMVTVNGQPGATVLNTGAPIPERYLFTVWGDMQYAVVASPYDPAQYGEEATAAFDAMFETVQNSLSFFEPWR